MSHVYRCDKCGNEYPDGSSLVTVTHTQPGDVGDSLSRHFCSGKCYVAPTGPATDDTGGEPDGTTQAA